MPGPRSTWLAGVAVVALVAAALAGDELYDFMPDGGRTLLLRLTGEDSLAELAARDADADAWTAWALDRAPDLDPRQARTFAGYAEINFPLDADTLAALAASNDAAMLPPDGKDLAIGQCQFCHALFSGYLTHDRDETGWRGTFKSPFHKEIPMTEIQRDTFARYSALNMPLKFEDVPPELRF
ncbi:hypothetical protein ILP92_13210 [Maribius pontilimi]|uniref:Uncharacterized protein n=1 Tax=Palleronia pontilimi TaxID=1964209 RepID=A0A934MDP6_9RHOB|nr:hypothetical protein [Palleronia pontilimi]MBJ3763710.1 hypothetical protein [Palleronia pontilimi]